MLILEILKKYSDENNKLSQKEIATLVERDYSVPVDRHTLKRNLDSLFDFNCGVERATRDKNTGKTGGWYYERDFTDAEVRMLIDGLLFSKYIPYSECKDLVKKLEGLAGVSFKHSHGLPENRPENKEIFLNIEVLLQAMSAGKKVTFHLRRYGVDKKSYVKLDEHGVPRRYVTSPYEIVITNGRYYLIGVPDSGNHLFHYRLDNICNIIMLKNYKRRSLREIPGYGNGLKLAKYIKEHPYMVYSGDIVPTCFRVTKDMIGQVFDWFGKDIRLVDDTEDTVIVTVTVNEEAMLYWALQYGLHIEVLKPQSLRKKLQTTIKEMAKRYK